MRGRRPCGSTAGNRAGRSTITAPRRQQDQPGDAAVAEVEAMTPTTIARILHGATRCASTPSWRRRRRLRSLSALAAAPMGLDWTGDPLHVHASPIGMPATRRCCRTRAAARPAADRIPQPRCRPVRGSGVDQGAVLALGAGPNERSPCAVSSALEAIATGRRRIPVATPTVEHVLALARGPAGRGRRAHQQRHRDAPAGALAYRGGIPEPERIPLTQLMDPGAALRHCGVGGVGGQLDVYRIGSQAADEIGAAWVAALANPIAPAGDRRSCQAW